MKVVFLGTASCFPTPSRSVILLYVYVSVVRIRIAFKTYRIRIRHFALLWVRMQGELCGYGSGLGSGFAVLKA
jgi:hypothetical protein